MAKRRIASNVLPATGPVSAGGDQVRDFESFRTYLVEELPFAIGFLALASTDVVVFACTIQQDKLRTKFEDDIEAICTQGMHVDRIYIFATADVPARLRHDLQAWARDRYEIGLEVIDGFALAEWPSEPDLYWIAQQYLELPAELAPSALDDAQVKEVMAKSWLATWERAQTADSAKPDGAVRVRDARPRRLGVRAAIHVEGAEGELPPYAPRDLDAQLRSVLVTDGKSGCFVLLLGESAVGKTRTLYEAIQATLPDWWLVHPDSAEALCRLADAPSAHTVVWLDELQRYLGGRRGLTAGPVRALLQAGAVIVATMWPDEHHVRTASRFPGSVDQYTEERQLLDLAEVIDVAGQLSDAERDRVHQLATTDKRWRVAADSSGIGAIQTLAAAPALVRRWEHAPPYAKAVVTVAVDARRLGVTAPLTAAFFTDAVPEYLTPRQRATAPHDWLQQALTYATTPLHGAASTLNVVDNGTMGSIAGYLAEDYLLQHGRRTRRATCPPGSAWQALVVHVHDLDDARRLAYSADTRWRYRYAEHFYRRWAADGDHVAARRLADLLTGQDRVDEAVDLLRAHAEDGPAAGTLVALLARQGDVEALRARADAGDRLAASWLVELLARRGDVDALRTRAEEGDRLAAGLLMDLHGDREYLDALTARAEAGDQLAEGHLAALLTEQPRSRTDPPIARLATDEGGIAAYEEWELDDGSIEVLNEHQVCRFTDLLITGGHIDAAVAFLEACSEAAVASADDYLTDLLADHGRIDQLRARAATGEWSSNHRLADLLAAQGYATN